MALRTSTTPPMSPAFNRKRKSFARRCERLCCNVLSLFPLVFVYGLTTWALWVQVHIGFMQETALWTGTSFPRALQFRRLTEMHRSAHSNTSRRAIYAPQLVVYNSGLGRSGLDNSNPQRLFLITICRSRRQHFDHGEIYRRYALL